MVCLPPLQVVWESVSGSGPKIVVSDSIVWLPVARFHGLLSSSITERRVTSPVGMPMLASGVAVHHAVIFRLIGRRVLEAVRGERCLAVRDEREYRDAVASVFQGRVKQRAHDRASGASSTCWSMRSLARMNSSSVSSASGPKQMVALPLRLMMRVI